MVCTLSDNDLVFLRPARDLLFQRRDLPVALRDETRQLLDLLFGLALGDRGLEQFRLAGPELVGPGGHILAHGGEHLLRRLGPRTQAIELELQRVDVALAALLGLLALRRGLVAVRFGGGHIPFQLLDGAARAGERALALGQLLIDPRRLAQCLVQGRLKRALVVLQQGNARVRAHGFRFHGNDGLVRGIGALNETRLLGAEDIGLVDLVRELFRRCGERGARRCEFMADPGSVRLGVAPLLQRGLHFLGEILVGAFQLGRLFRKLQKIAMQLLVAQAQRRERAVQAGIVGLFLLQRREHAMQRLDELAEGVFELMDGAELLLRVEQEIAERFVVLADPGPQVGKTQMRVGAPAPAGRQDGPPMEHLPEARNREEFGYLAHGPPCVEQGSNLLAKRLNPLSDISFAGSRKRPAKQCVAGMLGP